MRKTLQCTAIIALMLPGAALAAPSWAGWYGGVNGGYAFDGKSTKSNTVDLFGTLTTGETDKNTFAGGLGGAELGYNFQASNFVFGPELEASFQNLRGSSDANNPPPLPLPGETVHTSIKSSYMAAASLRVGYSLGDVLLFGKGGLAFTNFHHQGYIFDNASGTPLDLLKNDSRTSIGFLIGGGAELALNENWSVGVEYNYIDYSSIDQPYHLNLDYATATPTLLDGSSKSKESEQLIKFGVIYRF